MQNDTTFYWLLVHLVVLDKIILVEIWTHAERLIWKRLLSSYYIFRVENTKVEEKA